MSANNRNNNAANGPSTVQPKSRLSPVDKIRKQVTETGHYVLRLYFSILLLVYFWFVKIFARILQPLEPFLQSMHKVPAGEATPEGIRQQLSQLLYTILLYLTPFANRLIAFLTRPLAWARDRLSEYVEEGEKETLKKTDPKAS